LVDDFLISVQILGGNVGFDKKVWEVTEYKKGETPSITFKYESHDGEEGSVYFLFPSHF
jgi:galactose mutarotase-like enzyme